MIESEWVGLVSVMVVVDGMNYVCTIAWMYIMLEVALGVVSGAAEQLSYSPEMHLNLIYTTYPGTLNSFHVRASLLLSHPKA